MKSFYSADGLAQLTTPQSNENVEELRNNLLAHVSNRFDPVLDGDLQRTGCLIQAEQDAEEEFNILDNFAMGFAKKHKGCQQLGARVIAGENSNLQKFRSCRIDMKKDALKPALLFLASKANLPEDVNSAIGTADEVIGITNSVSDIASQQIQKQLAADAKLRDLERQRRSEGQDRAERERS